MRLHGQGARCTPKQPIRSIGRDGAKGGIIPIPALLLCRGFAVFGIYGAYLSDLPGRIYDTAAHSAAYRIADGHKAA